MFVIFPTAKRVTGGGGGGGAEPATEGKFNYAKTVLKFNYTRRAKFSAHVDD